MGLKGEAQSVALCGLRDIVANCELRIEEFRDLRYSILDNDLPFTAYS